jgi:hypothetical protein
MSKQITQDEYDKLTLEQKAAIWQNEADKLRPGSCKDQYNKQAAAIRARGKK